MTYTDKLKATRLIFMIGDGADPEIFTVACGISEKGLSQTRQTSDTVDWDCADPDAVPITIRDINQADWSVSGNGLLHRPMFARFQEAYDSTETVNVRIVFDEKAGDEVIDGYFEGPAVLTQFDINGTNGQYITAAIGFQGAGKLNFVGNS